MIRASAPGKLMLTGEYTVTEPGGVALAVAVGRRVRATCELGGTGWRVTSEAMGLSEAEASAVPILALALERTPGLPGGGLLTIDSDLGHGGDKLGLGASAALTVAATATLRRAASAPDPTLEELVAIHRDAHAGRGSGYDVATSLCGGALVYQNGPDALSTEPVPWPEGLHAAVFHTGTGASTGVLLERVACWYAEDPEDLESFRAPLAEEARAFIEAWRAGDIARILTAAAQVQEELDAFDRAGEIGIYAGGQMQLLAAVEDAGAIGRTSGAGGGDCVWALSHSAARIEAAKKAAEALGYNHLGLELGVPGLQFEEGQAG